MGAHTDERWNVICAWLAADMDRHVRALYVVRLGKLFPSCTEERYLVDNEMPTHGGHPSHA